MKMRFILTGLLSILMFISNAQDLISTGGDFFQMESGSISFTIGEPIIETLGNEDHILTQGFQQSNRDIATGNNELEYLSINIYPNPTTDFVTVELSEIQELDYQLFDLNGIILSHGQISQTETTISLNNYIPSIFILKLIDNNQGNRTFQIVKK